MDAENVKRYFTDREDEHEGQIARKLYEEKVKGNFSDEELEKMGHFCFIMYKPDTLARGLGKELTQELIDNRIYPISAKKILPQSGTLGDMYMFEKEMHPESWWAKQKAYMIAPVIPILAVGKTEDGENLCARVTKLIGPSLPLLCDEKQTRGKFRGTSRVFNLLEASKDPAMALREALVFFSLKELKEALGAVDELNQGKVPKHVGVHMIEDITGKNGMPRTLNVVECFLRYKVYGLEIVEKNKDYGNPLKRLHELLGEERAVLNRGFGLWEERERLKPILAEENVLINDMRKRNEEQIRDIARMQEDQKKRINLARRSRHEWRAIKFMDAVTRPEHEFIGSEFDRLLLNFESLMDVDPIDEINMHTYWATLPETLKDIESRE